MPQINPFDLTPVKRRNSQDATLFVPENVVRTTLADVYITEFLQYALNLSKRHGNRELLEFGNKFVSPCHAKMIP